MRLVQDQRAPLALLGVLLVAALLAWPGVHEGFSLYYDEAVHLVTARALARGHGYIDESLPGTPSHRKYPPVLSLILAPFWRLSPEFPENLAAMRLMMLTTALLSLGLSYRYLIEGQRASPPLALTTVAAVGWHGLFLTFATFLSSEMIYALLSMASLLAYARFETGGRERWLLAAVTAAGLAAATRTVGLALLAALILHLALRRHMRAALATFGAALAITVPWQMWGWAARQSYRTYPPEVANNYVGYLGQLVLQRWVERLPTMLTTNARTLAESWGSLILPWAEELLLGTAWSVIAGLLVAVIVAWRLMRLPRAGLTVADLYVAGYLTLVVLWPWPFNERFLLVVAPLLVFPALDIIKTLVERPGSPSRASRLAARLGSVLLVTAILLTTLGHLWLRWSVSERYEAMRENFQQMLDWVERQTPQDAVLVGAFDPLYYLMTGRRAVRLAYPDPFVIYYNTREERRGFPEAARLLAWYRQIGACWVVQDPMIGEPGMITYYYGLIQALRGVSEDALQEVYRAGNGWFAIYRLRGCPTR